MDNYGEILCGKKQPCRFLCRFGSIINVGVRGMSLAPKL